MELFFKIIMAVVAVIGLGTSIYNVRTTYRRSKLLQQEQRETAQLQDTILLAVKTEQRVTALEGRVGSFEQRIERRIDQISADIGQVKDLFTNYLINKH